MQSIQTKYIPPTDFKGSRVKASAQAGSVTLDWDDALNQDDNHTRVAHALAAKLGWHGEWIGGERVDGRGATFVCIDRDFAVGTFTIEKPAAVRPSRQAVGA